jgi:integrase
MLDGNLFKNHNVPGPWEGARKRRLEEGELDKLKEAAQRGYEHRNEWPLLIEFAIATAARSQEILKAEWKEVNIAGRAWNIPEEHVKTSTFRQIPLSKKAIDILHKMADMKSATSPRIFHMWKDSSTISKGFRRLTARAGVENLRFHDLRHEATSLLFEKTTMSDIEIMQMTGHTNIATLEGYAHLRASYVADKLDAIK